MNITVTMSLDAVSLVIDALAATPVPDGAEAAISRSHALHRMFDAYSRGKASVADRGFKKWDVLHPAERAMLDATPFGDGNQSCSKCGTVIATEGAFARHYVVSDRRYLNLGSCPN